MLKPLRPLAERPSPPREQPRGCTGRVRLVRGKWSHQRRRERFRSCVVLPHALPRFPLYSLKAPVCQGHPKPCQKLVVRMKYKYLITNTLTGAKLRAGSTSFRITSDTADFRRVSCLGVVLQFLKADPCFHAVSLSTARTDL